MKRLLLFSVLSIFCLTISAQTKTWIGSSGGYFSNASNWDPVGVPNLNNDIILPPGSNMIMDAYGIINAFQLQGNAMMTINNHFKISAVSSISPNSVITWNSGFIQGDGTIMNQGTFNIEGADDLLFQNSLIFNNQGIINVNLAGTFRIGYGSPTLNNLPTGVINLNSDRGIAGGSGAGTIINTGLIKRSQGTGVFSIGIPLENNDGTILVETGTLKFQSSGIVLSAGTYNVSAAGILEWADNLTCVGTLAGQLDGPINWTGIVHLASGTEATFDFDGPAGVNWYTGYLVDSGTLVNAGILNLEGDVFRAVQHETILNNTGSINFNGTGTFALGYGSPTLNNLPSGVLNLKSDSNISGGSGVGTIVNTGLIKRSQGTGVYTIGIPLHNNDGDISVESGTLKLQSSGIILTDGTYDIDSDGIMEWADNLTCVGTLTGQLDGSINWTGIVHVDLGTEAIFDFSGTAGVNWLSGTYNGDGTLTNAGIFNLEGANGKTIAGLSIFKNEGNFNINSTANLAIGYGTPTLTNTASGIININSDGSISGGSGNGNILNTGIIKKASSSGNFSISSNVTNTIPGKIIADTGNLNLTGDFLGNGIITGNGSIQLANTISFEGTISPGGFPGTLTHEGNFTASANAILATEIHGPTPSTEYDVFDVQGDAHLDGNILLYLTYAANLNDEFVILTATSISSCNLPATVTANYDGHTYTFNVICNATNVTIKVTDIVLGTQENTLSNLSIYPNPNSGQFTIDLGKEYTDVTVQVVNMLGQIISSENYASAKTISKEITNAAGVYFVRVSTAKEGSHILRVIKQ